MRYGVLKGDKNVEIVPGDSSGGTYRIRQLTFSTTYTIEVAAVNSAGTGPYSTSLNVDTDKGKYR